MCKLNNQEISLQIGHVLAKEFGRSWLILREAMENISDKDWNNRTNNWSFSNTVYHIIETAEYYHRNTPEGMEWGKRAGFSWTDDSEETILRKMSSLTKNDLIEYLDEIEKCISQSLEKSTNEDLFGTDSFDNGMLHIIEKMLYLLRHNMHHIGELNKVLRDTESKRIKWQ